MAGRGHANNGTIAEHVVLAIDQLKPMTHIEIGRIEAVRRGEIGVQPGLPFTTLDDHRRIRNEGVAANMVEVEMRVDDEIDARGITTDSFQPSADFFAWAEPDVVKAGHSFTEPAGGIMLAVRMQTSIEQRPPFRMFDQEHGNRHDDLTRATLHDTAKITLQVTTGERLNGQVHNLSF
jgi:hypothetical protein